MATIQSWKSVHWAWGNEQATIPDGLRISYQGPSYGNNGARVKINLGALGTEKKRSRLKVNIKLYCSVYTNELENSTSGYTRPTIYATLTDTDRNPNDTNFSPAGKTIASFNSIYSSRKVGEYSYLTLDLDVSSLNKNEQDVYLYLLPRTETGIWYVYYIFEGSVTEETADDITAVTTNTITNTTGNFYTPSENITVTWNAGKAGINNQISGYKVFLKVGSAPTAADSGTTVSSTITSHTFSSPLKNQNRGSDVWVGVQALGTKTGFNGAIQTKKIGRINQLPPAPSYSASGNILNSAVSIFYTINSGSDLDGQSLSLYYSLNGGAKQACGASLTIKLGSAKEGTNTIIFYNYDGKEYSNASNTHTFNAIFKPVINNISQVFDAVSNINNTPKALVKTTSLVFTLSSGSSKTIELYVRSAGASSALSGDGKLVPTGQYSYNNSSKTITIPITTLSTDLVGYGSYFQFRFKVSDGSNVSDFSSWQPVGRRPSLPVSPSAT